MKLTEIRDLYKNREMTALFLNRCRWFIMIRWTILPRFAN